MNLSLNQEQFKKLLAYSYIGYQIIASNKELRDEDVMEDETFINDLYRQAQEAGSDCVEFYEDEYIPSESFEETLLNELEEYEDDITFDTLCDWLAMRDLLEEHGAEAIENMSDEDYLQNLEDQSEAYGEEFAEYGIENLYLIDKKAN